MKTHNLPRSGAGPAAADLDLPEDDWQAGWHVPEDLTCGAWMTAIDWTFSLSDAQAHLPDDPAVPRGCYGLRHGTMKVGLYAPREADTQTMHEQDELYIVISGSGEFVKDDERRSFKSQDVILVEARASHRFENFSSDFATWVVFWGPPGGEA